jgi:hypothetical protein
MIKILIGLIIVLFGAGGVEHSSDYYELSVSVAVAMFGVFLMFLGSKQI